MTAPVCACAACRPLLTIRTRLVEVRDECVRQHVQWGEQNHPDGTGPDVIEPCTGYPITNGALADAARLHCDRMSKAGRLTYADILREEVREALAEADPARLRSELIQVAAVAVSWVEAIDRRVVREAS